MLTIEIPSVEVFDELESTFTTTKAASFVIEHSLVSVSKWESKWCVPFLSKVDKTEEETIDYIRCMTLTQNVEQSVYSLLTQKNIIDITDYINAPMTATTITQTTGRPNREIITAELIYYWMIALNVPFECQKWHLNRLLTLISVCSIKQQPPKKMRGRALAKSNSALNAQRRGLTPPTT